MGIFGGPSKQQIQRAKEKIRQEQAQKLAEAKSKAQQIIAMQEGMKADSKCQALMDKVEAVIAEHRAGFQYVVCNPLPIKAENIAIFVHAEDPNAHPWDLEQKKTIKISYISYGLSLAEPTEVAFMYWLLKRNPFLTYKDYRGPSRDMEDVLIHSLSGTIDVVLRTLYNSQKL